MAHIKCRYRELYCGLFRDMERYGKPCNANDCDCGIEWYFEREWNIPACEAAYLVTCEFEKTVKNYEYIGETGINRLPELRIGKKIYDRILYLEIDGVVMVEPQERGVKE
jgi:hypothetical protein